MLQLGLQQQLEGLLQARSCLAGFCHCLQGTPQRSFAGAAQQHIRHRSSIVHSSCSGMLQLLLLLLACVLCCGVLPKPQTKRIRQFTGLCAVGDPDISQLQATPRRTWFLLPQPQLPLGVGLLLCLHSPRTGLFWLPVGFVLLPRLLGMLRLWPLLLLLLLLLLLRELPSVLLLLLACSCQLLGALPRPLALQLKHPILLHLLLLLLLL